MVTKKSMQTDRCYCALYLQRRSYADRFLPVHQGYISYQPVLPIAIKNLNEKKTTQDVAIYNMIAVTKIKVHKFATNKKDASHTPAL